MTPGDMGCFRQGDRKAGRMPAPQGGAPEPPLRNCGAGFQPAERREDLDRIIQESEPPLQLGSCVLGKAEVAEIVQKALLFFENRRYWLRAWCIMPNHVHTVVAPLWGHTLSQIMHSWKSFTAKEINRLLGRRGVLWERESFDHLIRSVESLEHLVQYTIENPAAAGLCKRPDDWVFSSCGAGFQPAEEYAFVEPRQTPYTPMRGRGELPHLHKASGTYFVTFRLFDAVV